MKRFTVLVCLLLSSFCLKAADYYWVGGTGGWSDVNHWRLGSTAGSIPGIVPSSGDNVIFGPGSGFTAASRTVTLDANAFCNSMTWTINVPNSPTFTRTGASVLNIAGSLFLAPTVTYSGIPVTFTTASAVTLTTNGSIQGSMSFDINKPGGSFTLVDDLIYATPSSSGNAVTLTAGAFNAAGKKIATYTFATSSGAVRSLDISNTDMNIYLGYNCQGAGITLNAAGSVIRTGRFFTDAGTYNIVELGATVSTYFSIVNTTFKKLTFVDPSSSSQARIHSGNTIDSLIFKGAGAVWNGNNTVNYVSWGGSATIGSSGNYLKYVTIANGPLSIVNGGGNTFDTLLTTPNKNISISGPNTINKYFRAGGAPCAGFTELTGVSSGALGFAPGAIASIDNVLLTNMGVTGSVAPLTVNGIDGDGNSGFIINSPSAVGTTLYWVNGAGDWNDNSHWSFSSGGAGGACIPFIYDNVVFDANSGFGAGSIVATTGNTYCNNMTWAAGITGTPKFNESASFTLQVYGSVVLNPAVTMTASLDLRGTSAATLRTNGSTLGVSEYIIRKTGSPTAGLTLLDNWTNSSSAFTLVSGILDLSGRTVDIYAMMSTSSLTRTLNMSNANISVTNWNYSGNLITLNATNSYLLARSSLITRTVAYNVVDCAGTVAGNLDVAGTTFGQLTFTNTGLASAARIHAGNTIRKLEFMGMGMIRYGGNVIDSLITAPNRNFFFYETGVGSNTTINKYYKALHPSCSGLGEVRSGTTAVGTIKFGPNAKVDIANVYLENIAATGGGGTLTLPIPFSGADAGGNSGWTIATSTGSARYWVGGSGDWNDANHWSTTSNGAGGACIPTVGDDVYFDAGSGFTAASKTVTVNNGNAYFHNMSWAGAANDPIFNKNGTWIMECWGNSIVLNPVSTLNISPLSMKGPEAAVMSGQCKGAFDVEVNKPGSGLTLVNDFTNTATNFLLMDGNFTASGRVLNIGGIDNFGRDNNIALDISGSTIKGGIRYNGGTTKRTLNAANSNITGSVILNGFTYNIITVDGTTAGNATISNTTIKSLTFSNPANNSAAGVNGTNNTIGRLEYKGSGGIYGTGNIIDTLIFFPGDIYTFNAGTNTTITREWFGSGTPCRLTEIKSGSATVSATITKTSGAVAFDYIRLQRMTATGGAAFSVGQHSSDQGNNTGWTIAPYNGSSPILGLGNDVEICAAAFPYELNTQGFFGSPSSQYLWNDNSTQDKFMAPGPGKYSVTVSFPDGCSVKDTIEVKQTLVPVAPITGTTSICIGSTSALSSVTPGGVWSSSATAIATVDASGVVTPVAVGTATITYTVTNGGGCVASQTAIVTVNSLPVVNAITGVGVVCVDGTTTLSSTTPSGVWSSGNVAVATVNAAGVVTGVTAGTATITYTVTNANGCVASQTKAITVNGLPVVDAITGAGAVCIGGTTTLSTTTVGGVWSSSDATVASVNVAGMVTGVSNGTAIIRYTVTNANGCVASQTRTVTVNSLPVVNAITGTGTVCVGSNTTLSSTTVGGVWSSSDATIASVNASGVVTGVSNGTATITYRVTNASGCVASATATVTVNNLPVVNAITGVGTVCVGSNTTLSSTTVGGVWSSGDATIASVNASGVVTGVSNGTATITYRVTNASGCVAAATATVTVNSLPVVNAITGVGTACVGSNTTLSSTTVGGVWSSSDATIASVNASGVVTGVSNGTTTITYTVTNGSGCVASQAATVTVNSLPVVNAITGVGTVCIGSNTTLSSTTVGGVWSSSDATIASVNASGVVTGVSNGTATITYRVTNANGCVASATATVTVNSLPVVNAITGVGTVCIGSNTTLSSTTVGGVWSSSDATIASVNASGVVTGVSNGTATITYTVTNGSGCEASQAATVTVNNLPVVNAITGVGTVCIGSNTTLSSTTVGGVWSSSDAAVASVDAAGVVTGVSSGTATITYTVTNASGCVASATATVTVNSLPVVNAITGVGTVCIGSNTTLSSTTPGGVWSSGDATIASVNASGVVTGVSNGTAAITYTVTNASGCVASNTATVTVNNLPVVNAITGAGAVCIGSNATLSSTTVGGVWSSSDATIASVNASGVVTGVSNGTATITYTVTNASGCVASQTATVTVNSLPVVNTITGVGTVCVGSTTALSSTTVGGVWSSSDATIASVNASGVVTGVSNGTATITYTVTNASGCVASQTATVIVNSLPVVNAITGAGAVCIGSNTTLSSTTLGGVWSSSDATIASVNASGVVTGVSNGTATITYTVTNANGCVAFATATVTVNSLPVVNAITGANAVCVGSTTTLSSTTAGGVWSSSDATIASVNASGVVTGVSNGTATITYTVTNASGCVASQTATVTVNNLPVVNAITGVGTVCVGSNTTLSSTTVGGVWSSSYATIASVNASGIVTGVSNGTTTITYTVTNASGCVASATATVTVNSLPVVNAITGAGAVCIGSNTTLSSTTVGGVWSSSDATIASVNASGVVTGVSTGTATITYTVTNASGCVASNTATVTANSLPVVSAITGAGAVCIGSNTTLSSTTPNGVWSSSDAAIASVNTTGVVTGVSTGTATITYTVTNASGCVASNTATVTVNSLPVVSAITGTRTVCIGSNTTLSSTTVGGVWSSSDAAIASVNTTGVVTGVSNGTATITYTVTNASGCVASNTATVTVNSLPVVNAITGTATVCIGKTTTLSTTTPGGVWSSSDATIASVNASGVVTGVSDGTAAITYTVTNASGCTNSIDMNITVNTCVNPQPPLANNDVAVTSINIPVKIDLAANDIPNDGSLDYSSVSIVSQPTNGTLIINADGTVTYTPVRSFTGIDIFSYTIRNTSNLVSNTATVTVTVKPIPVAVNDTAQTLPGKEVLIRILDNDTGLSDFAGIIITKQPVRGSLKVNADGTVVYTPDAGFKGVDEFTYKVKDLAGNMSNEARVTITVADDGFFIPNAITPNNDGINDRFVIPDLYKYPGSSLSVFNRWGNEVYHSSNYNNSWDGNGLGGGTYYYVLKLNTPQGIKAYKGWIQLLK